MIASFPVFRAQHQEQAIGTMEPKQVPQNLNPWTALKSDNESTTRSERVVWLIFCFTSVQLAFLQPNVMLIPGERAKVFSGVLCALSLILAWLLVRKNSRSLKSPEVIISLALLVLVGLSGLFSLTPRSSSFRGFVVMASGLGGFWCARILLDTQARQVLFAWLCLLMLAAIVVLCLAGYFASGQVEYFLDVNPHPLADRMLLLSFAPLAFVFWGRKPIAVVSVIILVFSYAVFYLSDLRSAMLIPLALAVLAVLFGTLRLKYFVALFVPLLVIIVFFFYHLPKVKIGPEYEPTYYRAENYPFSWHIAVKHPILGIGLRAPREQFLEDYKVKYPYVTKEKFAESVGRVVTSENIFLTFMSELGFPFVILYSVCVLILLVRLVRIARNGEDIGCLPAVTVLLPLTAALIHFQVLDGLLHPQISWFFHILLGMIPLRTDKVI